MTRLDLLILLTLPLACTVVDTHDAPRLLEHRIELHESGPAVVYRFAIDGEIRELTLGVVGEQRSIGVHDERGVLLAAVMRSPGGHVVIVDGDHELVAADDEVAVLPRGALDDVSARVLTAELIASLPLLDDATDPSAFAWVTIGEHEQSFRRIYDSLGPDGGCIAWDTPQGGMDFVCWEAPFLCC
jgi:hypothetical protein